jgi:hypothetical protein
MTKRTINSKVLNKKLLLPGAIAAVAAVVILTGIFVVYPAIFPASAIQQLTNTTTGPENGQLPKITGSINVMQATKSVIKDNLKVPFPQAADIAGKQITNGTIIGGHLGIVQGYLVYTFFAVNSGTHTGYLTIIDAGNGKVLYTSPGLQMGGDFSGIQESLGPHGLAGGFGHGPFGFGQWRSPWGFSGGLWH